MCLPLIRQISTIFTPHAWTERKIWNNLPLEPKACLNHGGMPGGERFSLGQAVSPGNPGEFQGKFVRVLRKNIRFGYSRIV